MLSKVSPMTNYYIRKLYRQKDPYLSRVEDLGDDFSTFFDLDQTLKTLYKSDELETIIRQLEILVHYHQTLVEQGSSSATRRADLEQRIFAMLGETDTSQNQEVTTNHLPSVPTTDTSASTITVEQILSILNDLRSHGATYLGDAIATNYLVACRPPSDWFQQFKIERSLAMLYQGSLDETLDTTQRQGVQEWVVSFIERCSQVIVLFPKIVNRSKLLAELGLVESEAVS
ncbi:MAG: hypothetical protein HC792_00705 [Acaryochloridaceae cyanobacterium CSU_5_19]|nr:hypothetical protein [Acaryochloridaceae cyanobacterium CSU_5_19]